MNGKLTTGEIHEIINIVVQLVQAELKCQREKDANLVREYIAEAIKQGFDDLLAIAGIIALRIETQPDETVAHVQQALRELSEERAKDN